MIPTNPTTIDTSNGFLFFWDDMPSITSTPDNSCLSQWYPDAFTEHGVTYNSAEHYMMAQKAILFHDAGLFNLITPRKPRASVEW